jgi:hypothetical protein
MHANAAMKVVQVAFVTLAWMFVAAKYYQSAVMTAASAR